jgi:hypothetical protein
LLLPITILTLPLRDTHAVNDGVVSAAAMFARSRKLQKPI